MWAPYNIFSSIIRKFIPQKASYVVCFLNSKYCLTSTFAVAVLYAMWCHSLNIDHGIVVQSIWGQNGLNPPQIATKFKLALCCKTFSVNLRNQKFTKINRVEQFQIAQLLRGPWGKYWKNRIQCFLSIWTNTCIFQINMVHINHQTVKNCIWKIYCVMDKLFVGLNSINRHILLKISFVSLERNTFLFT